MIRSGPLREAPRRRSLLRAAALGLGSMLPPWLPAARAVAKGDAAPEFELSGRQTPVRLADHRGKVVYLDFWASWCGPCRRSFPFLNEMQARYGARGLQVIGIGVDQRRADALAFLEHTPARFEIAFDPDGRTPRAYAVKGMPYSFLIDREGRLGMIHSGFRDDQREELERQIRAALGIA